MPLTDITSKSANAKRELDLRPVVRHNGGPDEKGKENIGRSKALHFTTPTFSSKQNKASASDTSDPRRLSPAESMVKAKQAEKASTPRRQVVSGSASTPRQNRTSRLAFPDKLAIYPRNHVQPSPSSGSDTSKRSPCDKPLPVLPSSNEEAPKTAKPGVESKRRSQRSPASVLASKVGPPTSSAVTSYGTSREISSGSPQLTRFNEKEHTLLERYPKFGRPSLDNLVEDNQNSHSKPSASNKTKSRGSWNAGTASRALLKIDASVNLGAPGKQNDSDLGGNQSPQISPAQGFIAKSILPKPVAQTEQHGLATQPSPLQSRLSTGPLVMDSRVEGATFANVKSTPTPKGKRSNSRRPVTAFARLQTDNKENEVPQYQPEFVGVNSHTPVSPRSSENRQGTPGCRSPLSTFPIPVKDSVQSKTSVDHNVPAPHLDADSPSASCQYDSSIQSDENVEKPTGEDGVNGLKELTLVTRHFQVSPTKSAGSTQVRPGKTDSNGANMEAGADLDGATRPGTASPLPSNSASESVPPKYSIVKRLSAKAQDYGPTLRISSSAERVIMGADNAAKCSVELQEHVSTNKLASGGRSTVQESRGTLLVRPGFSQRVSSLKPPTRVDSRLGRSSTAFRPAQSSMSKASVAFPREPYRAKSTSSSLSDPFHDAPAQAAAAQDEGTASDRKDLSQPRELILQAPKLELQQGSSHKPEEAKALIDAPAAWQNDAINTNAFDHSPRSFAASNRGPVGNKFVRKEVTSSPRSPLYKGSPKRPASVDDKQAPLPVSIVSHRKRDSSALESVISRKSLTLTASKSRFSLKTMFRKNVVNEAQQEGKKESLKAVGPIKAGSLNPVPALESFSARVASSKPVHGRHASSSPQSDALMKRRRSHNAKKTAKLISGAPDLSSTAGLAMIALDAARREAKEDKKQQLLNIGSILVDAVTRAREAEKAAEEAKLALSRAEMASALCKQAVARVENIAGDLINES